MICLCHIYFLLLAPIKSDSILWDVYVFIRNQFSEFSEVCSLLTSRGLYHCKQRAQSAGNRDREREQAEAARTKRQFLTHYRDNPVVRLTRGLIRLIRHGSSTPGWWGGGLLVTKDCQHRLVWGKLRGEDSGSDNTDHECVCMTYDGRYSFVGLDKQVTTNKKDFIHLTRPEVTSNLLSLPFTVYIKINVFSILQKSTLF